VSCLADGKNAKDLSIKLVSVSSHLTSITVAGIGTLVYLNSTAVEQCLFLPPPPP